MFDWQVLQLEEEKGEWGFKALKQMIKINFKLVRNKYTFITLDFYSVLYSGYSCSKAFVSYQEKNICVLQESVIKTFFLKTLMFNYTCFLYSM